MTTSSAQQLLREADFIEKYTTYYRRQFAAVMQQQAVRGDAASVLCVRMALEALDMMLDSKQAMVAAASQARN
jgi:hypothetical protein